MPLHLTGLGLAADTQSQGYLALPPGPSLGPGPESNCVTVDHSHLPPLLVTMCAIKAVFLIPSHSVTFGLGYF